MHVFKLSIVILALVIAAYAQEPLTGADSRPDTAAASALFRIRWDGELPAPRRLVIPESFAKRNPEEAAFCDGCAKRGELVNEELLIDTETRGIANAAVSLTGITGDTGTLEPAVIDNIGCRFAPHVQFSPVGRPFAVKNSDAFVHNARITVRGSQEFWNALITAGTTAETRPVMIAGTYTVVCDIHPWMKAYVIATRHPWCSVTNASGEARLEGLTPAMKQAVVVWHETLGVARIELDLEAGTQVERELTQHDFKKP